MSAVSKKLMPASIAWRIRGRLCSSSRTHSRHFFEPYVIVPRQTRETLRPVEPRFTYSIAPTSYGRSAVGQAAGCLVVDEIKVGSEDFRVILSEYRNSATTTFKLKRRRHRDRSRRDR